MYVGNSLGQSSIFNFKPVDQKNQQTNSKNFSTIVVNPALKQVKRHPNIISDLFRPVSHIKGTLPTSLAAINLGGKLDFTKENALNKRNSPTLKLDLDDDGLRELQAQAPDWLSGPSFCGDVEISSQDSGISNNLDFMWANMDLGAASHGTEQLGQSIEYMASRYAALRDRIESQYIGEEKSSNLERLDKMMNHYKNSLAQQFADEVGGVFEENGIPDIKERLYQSVLSEVSQKTKQYLSLIKEQPEYANINGPDEAWLKKDTAYMASELRKAMSNSKLNQIQNTHENNEFTLSEMEKLQDFGQEIESYTQDDFFSANRISIGSESEESLGLKLATLKLKGQVFNQYAGVSDKVRDIVTQSIDHFIPNTVEQQQAYMNKWSQIQIIGYKNLEAAGDISESLAQQHINGIQKGFSSIDTDNIYDVINTVLESYNKTGNASTAILDGAIYANNKFAEKQESGLYDGVHRYDNGDTYWRNFFKVQDSHLEYKPQQPEYDGVVASWNNFMKKVTSESSALLNKFQFVFNA